VEGDLLQGVLARLAGGQPQYEGKDDSAVDHAASTEGRLRRFVAHGLVEMELGGVEDQVGEDHVLAFADRPSPRMDDDVAHLEILEVVVPAGQLLAGKLTFRQPAQESPLLQVHAPGHFTPPDRACAARSPRTGSPTFPRKFETHAHPSSTAALETLGCIRIR